MIPGSQLNKGVKDAMVDKKESRRSNRDKPFWGVWFCCLVSVCEMRNVQNGNCFWTCWDACVASVVDFGFWVILDFRMVAQLVTFVW